jgi:hypothetical protein
MIATLYDRHPGAHIAVVGTAPSVSSFSAMADITIALNGAICLPFRFDYHVMFDKGCPRFPMWTHPTDAIKVIGANIARENPALYREYHQEITQTSYLQDDWLEAHPPTPPHVWFYYQHIPQPRRTSGSTTSTSAKSTFERTNYLTHKGTVAHIAVQLAWLMGAAKITLGGIELRERMYRGSFGHMVALIAGLRERGVEVEGFDESPLDKLPVISRPSPVEATICWSGSPVWD